MQSRVLVIFQSFFLLVALSLLVIHFLEPEKLMDVMDTLLSPNTSLAAQLPTLIQKTQEASWMAGVGFFVLFLGSLFFRSQLLHTLGSVQSGYLSFRSELTNWIQTVFSPKNKGEILLFLMILTTGIFLRLFYINQPIRSDEATVFMHFAKKPLLMILANYSNVGNHIFHTLLLHFSWILFGDALWVIRLPTVIVGILLIPLAYCVFRYAFGARVALLGSALVATSSALIEYSVNARGYEIHAFFVLCLMGLAQYLLFHSKNYFAWALWIGVTALGFWNIPTMIYAYGGICLWLFLSTLLNPTKTFTEKRIAIQYFIVANLLSGILILILYSPVLITFRMGHLSTMLAFSEHASLSELFGRAKELWGIWLRNIPEPIQWILVSGLLIGLLFQFKEKRFKLNFLLCSILWLAILSVFLPLFGLHPHLLRLWLGHSLFLYLTIALGLVYCLEIIFHKKIVIQKIILNSLCLVLVSVTAFFEIKHQYVYHFLPSAFQEAKEVAHYLKDTVEPDAFILACCPYGHPLEYEFQRQGVPYSLIKAIQGTDHEQIYLVLTKEKTEKKPNQVVYIIEGTHYKGLKDILEESQLSHLNQKGIQKVMSFKKATIYKTTLD